MNKNKKGLNEKIVKIIFKKIAWAVKYLHEKNIVHQDLKLENILYNQSKNVVKLIDFGFSSENPEKKNINYICGTPHYMSPQAIKKQKHCLYKADIWALGIILYKLLTGDYPFRCKLLNNII